MRSWYVADRARRLARGQMRSYDMLGHRVAVWRDDAGSVHALDAVCPHLGADLGQGRLVAGCLECPFHHWRWSREGACLEVPYSKSRPTGTPARAWPCRDRNGFVYVWQHADGVAPQWEVEEVPESVDPRYRITARKFWAPFPSHPQELSENGVDIAHFDTIHKFGTRGIDWRPKGHAYSLAYDIEPLDTGLEGDSRYSLESFTEGPSCTRSRFSGALNGITMHSWTPVDPGMLTIHSLYIFRDDVSDEAAQRVFENSQQGWAADVEIWSHKRYRAQPLLMPEENLVPEFRRWFSQFY